MSEQVRYFVDCNIKPGQADNVRNIIKEALGIVAKEPGTLLYDFYINDKENTLFIEEIYADSNAVLAHLGNVGETVLPKLMEACDVNSIRVLSPVSQEVLTAFAALPATFHEKTAGHNIMTTTV